MKHSLSLIQLDMIEMNSDITSLKIEHKFDDIGLFEPASVGGGYINIKSDGYVLPTALKSQTKSPGGYEAIFDIGKPYAVTLKNVKITVTWSPNLKAIDNPSYVNYVVII